MGIEAADNEALMQRVRERARRIRRRDNEARLAEIVETMIAGLLAEDETMPPKSPRLLGKHHLFHNTSEYPVLSEPDMTVERLGKDYDAMDRRARGRLTFNERFSNDLRRTNPDLFFFLELERSVEAIVKTLMQRGGPDSAELIGLVADQERQREFADRLGLIRAELLEVLNLRSNHTLSQRLAHRVDTNPDSFYREPPNGYFPSEEVVEDVLGKASRNAYERRRSQVHQKAKEMLRVESQASESKSRQRRFAGKMHEISTVGMFYESRAFARRAHHKVLQTRATGEAYLTHPDAVALLSLYACGENAKKTHKKPDPRVIVAAAYAHDTIEDTETTRQDVEHHFTGVYYDQEWDGERQAEFMAAASAFGQKVAAIVSLVSEDEEMSRVPKELREKSMISRIQSEPNEEIRQGAFMVKLADRIHNLRTLGGMPDKKKMLRKLRTSLAWCEAAREYEERGGDTCGLGLLLVIETQIMYDAFERTHGELLEPVDAIHRERLEALWYEMSAPGSRFDNSKHPFLVPPEMQRAI